MSDILSLVNGAINLVSGSPLKLGSVSFTSYAIPEKIPFGGRQRTSIKRLIGGRKIVESLGPDPVDPTWSGRFQGSQALAQARAVQAMMEAGLPVQLSYGGMLFTVVITSFLPILERRYQIPYTITCTIVTDDSSGGFLDQSLDDLVGADVLDSLGVGDLIGDVTLSDALSTVQTGLQVAGSLTGNPAISQISGYINDASNIASGISAVASGNLAGAALGTVSGITSLGLNTDRIAGVIASANTLANSNAVTNLLSRAQINLAG